MNLRVWVCLIVAALTFLTACLSSTAQTAAVATSDIAAASLRYVFEKASKSRPTIIYVQVDGVDSELVLTKANLSRPGITLKSGNNVESRQGLLVEKGSGTPSSCINLKIVVPSPHVAKVTFVWTGSHLETVITTYVLKESNGRWEVVEVIPEVIT